MGRPLPVVEDTVTFLLGTWSIERMIDDHRTGATGRFTGTAEIACSPEHRPGTATYQEHGVLHWGGHDGHDGPAERRLVYERRPDGSAEVLFADGAPFFSLRFDAGRCEATHLCGDDRYDITLVAHRPDEIEERWRVRGPAKDYDAVAVLRRRR